MDSYVPRQDYGGQPGGGGNSVGVPGGRGPQPLGSIQNIGQSATGIPQQGGQTDAQQPSPQSQTLGIQAQQPQRPPLTPSSQEMGKPAHLQAQSVQQSIYVINQTKPTSPTGARQQVPRVVHRGGQGGGAAQVVGMQGVGGRGGQQMAMYPHPGALPVPPGAVYMQGQVPLHPSHAGPHQQSVYTMNSQMQPLQSYPPQKHQGSDSIINRFINHQSDNIRQHNQSCYPSYQPTIVAPNIFGYASAPTTQHAGSTQHVGSPLPGGQEATVVQQGGIQQPQPLQPMTISLGPTEVYQGHNGGGQNSANNSARSRKQRRKIGIFDIIDPKTGKNISEEIYDDDAATQSGDSSNRATPHPQDSNEQLIAYFEALVAEALSETSDSHSSANGQQKQSSDKLDINNADQWSSMNKKGEKVYDRECLMKLRSSPNSNIEPFNLPDCVKDNSKNRPPLKYTYSVDQWSPLNVSGKKVYDRDFLIQLQADPNSKIKPTNLPDLEVVLKDNSRNRGAVDMRQFIKDVGLGRHDGLLFPGFAKSQSSRGPLAPKRGSQQVKPKGSKSAVIRAMLCLPEDSEIKETATEIDRSKETDNPQIPSLVKLTDVSKEDSVTEDPHSRIRGVLKEPTPQKVNKLANEVEALDIHSQAQLQGVVDLVFETAINEPKSTAVCALLCKEFAGIEVTVPGGEVGEEDSIVDFRSLIIKRCILEFEDAIDENERAILKRDIEALENLGTIEFWQELTEEERRFRRKSFCNIRFMGELFRHGMLTSFIIRRCIRHLLSQIEDESLECLCKLLALVGKDLEAKNQYLEPNFKQILDIVNRRITGNVSPRVFSMLQNVIDLRTNKWIIPTGDIEITDSLTETKANEERLTKTMSIHAKEKQDSTPVIHEDIGNQKDQWSLLNMSGKKVYDREFLIKLQSNPNSKIKPMNLPDLEVVLKGNSKALASKQGSQQAKPKTEKRAVTYVSLPLREDVKLREAANVGKSDTSKPSDTGEEEINTEALYKKVRGVLDNLTPQTIKTLVNQVNALRIDSQEKLHRVIDLVFEKAIDEPNSTAACALMCKELAMMQVTGSDTKAGKKESYINFGNLIIDRCQMEFGKNTVAENVRAIQMKEIEACPDPDKKKELLQILNEEERKIRVKSVGNIRFIGELFKQGMLTTNIMHRCIRHLLVQIDEESLECLCMLFIAIGKDLEYKGESLEAYFKQMLTIVDRNGPRKLSSRVRFKLQYVIDLRLNKWIPSIADCKLKTLDKTKKKAEIKSSDMHLNNISMDVPREDNNRNRNGDGFNKKEKKTEHWLLPQLKLQEDIATAKNKEEEGDGGPIKACELLTLTSVETSELKIKSPHTENLQLGNTNVLKESKTVSANAPKIVMQNKFAELRNASSKHAEETLSPSASFNVHLDAATAIILEGYLSDTSDTRISNAATKVCETFDDTTFVNFVREVLNSVVERSVTARKQVSYLMTHLLSKNILPLPLYLAGLQEVLDKPEELEIYIPEIWIYLAELIWHPLAEGVHPFSELKATMASLKSKGLAGKLMVELVLVLVQEETPQWVKDEWDQSGLQWSDFLPKNESKDFIEKYELDFLVVVSRSASYSSLGNQLSMEEIRERLIRLMSHEKENSLIQIVNWISVNVGDRIIESEFVKVLMTAILEVTIEPYNGKWQFRVDRFRNLQALIPRYIDVSIKLLELQFLISIQEYIHQSQLLQRQRLQTIEKQTVESLISFDVFDALENNDDRRSLNRKSLAILALKSFFTSLKEKSD